MIIIVDNNSLILYLTSRKIEECSFNKVYTTNLSIIYIDRGELKKSFIDKV
jgi:hypothetical protein